MDSPQIARIGHRKRWQDEQHIFYIIFYTGTYTGSIWLGKNTMVPDCPLFDHAGYQVWHLIEACLTQMMTGGYQTQSPRIHLQCWHLKHLMFIFWRRWDNPFSERHKHSTLGTWLLAKPPILPSWLERILAVIQDNSSPEVEHWKRQDREIRPYGNLHIIIQHKPLIGEIWFTGASDWALNWVGSIK